MYMCLSLKPSRPIFFLIAVGRGMRLDWRGFEGGGGGGGGGGGSPHDRQRTCSRDCCLRICIGNLPGATTAAGCSAGVVRGPCRTTSPGRVDMARSIDRWITHCFQCSEVGGCDSNHNDNPNANVLSPIMSQERARALHTN